MWLAIDTSSARASVAWVDPANPTGAPLWQTCIEAGRNHNTLLFAPLSEAMGQPFADLLSAVIVGTGPGSYTGTRIGIAAAIGISLQKPGVAILPWPSCSALLPLGTDPCDSVQATSYLWASDARRGRFGLAQVRDGQLNGSPELFDQADALARCQRSLSEGIPVWTNDDRPGDLAIKIGLDRVVASRPDAALLAQRVAALHDWQRTELSSRPPLPIYLAAPFVTTPRTR